jgi:hypothetical protein
VQHLASQQTRGVVWQSQDTILEDLATPTKRSRTREAIDCALEDNTHIVRTTLVNKISLSHMVNYFLDFERLRLKLLRQPEDIGELISDHLYDRRNIAERMLILDSSLDSLLEELLASREQDPGAVGVALATDERPPSQRRFGGYRFQASMVYFPIWHPMETWDASETPPLGVSSQLLDICHCLGKSGPSVMHVVDKQLQRVGLSRYDVMSMVGDGGGENEGTPQGMHNILEEDVPGYVRRRCLGHMAWRVADNIIGLIPDYKKVNTCASTWAVASHGHDCKRSPPRLW